MIFHIIISGGVIEEEMEIPEFEHLDMWKDKVEARIEFVEWTAKKLLNKYSHYQVEKIYARFESKVNKSYSEPTKKEEQLF
jgi:nucleoid-associated protein YejK